MPTARTVWGLDIASSAVKGVRMRAEGDRVRILEADILPIERETKGAEAAARGRPIWQALQRFQEKHRLSAEPVVVGLPGAIFFLRPFNLSLARGRSEFELVRFEMEQHIPFGLDAVLWDYDVFEPADPRSREREGMLFAMKKEELNNYLLGLSAAGIEPAQVQAAPLALYNFVRYELNSEAPTLVADIGAGGTDLVGVAGRRYWVRTVGHGGDTMTAAIRTVFHPRDLSYEDAESIKTKLAQLPSRGEVIERITPPLREFVGEMANALRRLTQQHKIAFSRLILLGGAGRMYGLQSLLADKLGMRVITPAGLGRIQVVEKAWTDYVNDNLPLFATAIGLGLQGLGLSASRVNMVSPALAQRRTATPARRTAHIAFAAAAVLLILFGAFCAWRAKIYGDAVEGRNRSSIKAALAPVAQRLQDYERLSAPDKAEAHMAAIRRLAEGRSVQLMVLDKIARMLPENQRSSVPDPEKLWLLRLSLDPKPGEPGVYLGRIEAGTLIRPDGTHPQFARTVLKTPLETDPRFRNVSDIEDPYRSATLSYDGGPGPAVYFLCRIRFQVVPGKGDGS